MLAKKKTEDDKLEEERELAQRAKKNKQTMAQLLLPHACLVESSSALLAFACIRTRRSQSAGTHDQLTEE